MNCSRIMYVVYTLIRKRCTVLIIDIIIVTTFMDGFYDDFLKTSGNENILMCVVECTFKHEIYDIFNLF